MDTIKILLGVTVALLLGALGMSWKNFQQEERNAPKDELAEVRRQIEEIRLDQERLRLERDRIALGSTALPQTTVPAPTPAVPVIPMDASAEVPVVPDDLTPPEPDVLPPAPGPAIGDAEQRAQAIKNAPVVAKVTEWVDNKDIGTFATVEVVAAASVKQGTIVCLRRNAGILGRFKMGEITPEGAIANPMTQFGELKPKVGDELILEPVMP
jgi:hypothetical protein